MKDLERENIRLKGLVADLSLEKQIPKEVTAETKPRTAPVAQKLENPPSRDFEPGQKHPIGGHFGTIGNIFSKLPK